MTDRETDVVFVPAPPWESMRGEEEMVPVVPSPQPLYAGGGGGYRAPEPLPTLAEVAAQGWPIQMRDGTPCTFVDYNMGRRAGQRLVIEVGQEIQTRDSDGRVPGTRGGHGSDVVLVPKVRKVKLLARQASAMPGLAARTWIESDAPMPAYYDVVAEATITEQPPKVRT